MPPRESLGQSLRVIRITEEGEMTDDMLPFCMDYGLIPGKSLTVTAQTPEETLCESDGERFSVPGKFGSFIRWEKN